MNIPRRSSPTLLAPLLLILSLTLAAAGEKVKPSGRTVVAEVVAFDQAFMLNRLGSALKTPMIFALRKDVMTQDGTPLPGYKENPDLSGFAGKVCLKEYKRARPIVLRANVGDILEIRFNNLLTNQTLGQFAGCHVMGLSLATSIDDDSSWVGANPDASPSPAAGSFAPNAGPPGTPTPTPSPSASATKGGLSRVYRYFVDAEGVFILYSAADPTGAQGSNTGPIEGGNGLFGCVIVQPPDAEYYRSQVLRTDLIDATYDAHKLPANMVLHLQPKQPKQPNQPDKPEDGDHWFLTTYKTRLHDFVLKRVEVQIVPDDQVQAQTATSLSIKQAPPKEKAQSKDKPQPKEKALTAAALPKKQPQNVMRNLKTGEATEEAPPTDPKELRKKQEQGIAAPPGKLYAASSKHPLIDYQIAYNADLISMPGRQAARPKGWPVLEMLYPEAISLLKGSDPKGKPGNQDGGTVLQLEGGETRYRTEITQLDTGTIPRDLWPVLNARGIKEIPGITPRVAPQRGYFDPNNLVPGGGKSNYIWLLTGVNVADRPSSAVILHGNGDDFTLRFVEVELQLFHSDLTAIITGPQAEGFGHMQDSPSAFVIPASPERAQPYREFALGYHNGGPVAQAFGEQNSGPLASVTNNGNDNFGINYGMAGIATEILASRLGVGPEGSNRLGDGKTGGNNDGIDLKFEEFFLSSWAVGDPAMLVDRPANGLGGLRACPPATPTPTPAATPVRATKVFYPDDPSNVYHSYMRDHVKMRIYNAGENAPHVHHLHAHQWLRSPNSDEASYLDSQLIVPGSAFSLEIAYNGSGNRNQTVGDSIFHCHFYPHFAQGMWSLWRVHDVFEDGTPLDQDGKVVADQAKWVRALPDAEIETGTPIPAIVPLPTLAMPPIPPPVRVTKIPDLPATPGPTPAGGAASAQNLKAWVNISKDGKNPSMGRMAQVKPDVGTDGKTVFGKDGKPVFSNPGYPFFIPGVAGHRPPHPPLDMAWEEKEDVDENGAKVRVPDRDPKTGEKKYLDGGLPRHQVLGGQIVREFHTPWDFTKDYIRYDEVKQPDGTVIEKPADGAMVAYRIPEEGTPIEKAAMKAHQTRTVPTVQPDGRQGNFIHNGLEPVSGAPFADPGVDDEGNAVRSSRRYKAAVIQKDVVFNKAGWHYPQQRFITLWQDVKPTFDEKRPAQPFFFRANSGETVEYWHTNLVPEYYELDDFQIRTPTDIIGQHIHLVKFDVLASDGAVNGFNYEDGTISPDDVRGRIYAITRPFAKQTSGIVAAKYNLFEMSQPKAGDENYVAGIDWSTFVKTTPTPAPWKGSYLQKEMSQGEAGKANPLATPPGQNWDGAMTTIQRFSTDPLLNNQGIDRTVRTVFTHDHFGPSTHQQAGLYAGFLVEPEESVWRDPVTGGLYYDPVTRTDGGPTGWEAIIEPQNTAESYREFAVEFQDLQLAYTKDGAKALKPMKDLNPGDFQKPIVITNPSPVPTAGSPVIGVKVNNVTLTEFLRQNGISLTDTATFSALAPGVGIVDEAPNSLYRYGPNEAAFGLEKNGANFQVRFLHGGTWATPGQAIFRPLKLSPQIVSGGGSAGGTYSVNYRNEPLEAPVVPPNKAVVGRVGGPGKAADMAFAYASMDGRIPPWDCTKPEGKVPCNESTMPSLFARPKDPAETNGPWEDPVGFATGNAGINDGKISNWDPYTPLLRAYQGDPVQIRALVGAHMQPHSFKVNGAKWLGEMKSEDSGLRNAQEMGISEHFEFEFKLPPASTDSNRLFADYLYVPSSGATGQKNGIWGLLRSYDNPPKVAGDVVDAPIPSLRRLPKAANERPYTASHAPVVVKPPEVPDVEFTISAHAAAITYASPSPSASPPISPIQNANGMVYTVDKVQAKKDGALVDQNVSTKLPTPGGTMPPLILRASAGQWVKVILKNSVPPSPTPTPTPTPTGTASPQPGPSAPSTTVGLHSQLLAYDVSNSDGMNAGFNPIQTVPSTPPAAGVVTDKVYWWYAGDLEMNAKGEPSPTPRELGATNLTPADPLHQDGNGLLGALIVEPEGSTWDATGYVSPAADIRDAKGGLRFRDFVLIQQTNISASTSTTLAFSAVNNQSADLGFRLQVQFDSNTGQPIWTPQFKQALSNSLLGPTGGTPNTPIFTAKAGDPVRFRVLQPGGDSINGNIMFEIHGHSWQQEPWIKSSRELGDNPKSNVLGADILVPHKALNILIDQAGGPNKVPGDYLYYNFLAGDGAWGIFRVTP